METLWSPGPESTCLGPAAMRLFGTVLYSCYMGIDTWSPQSKILLGTVYFMMGIDTWTLIEEKFLPLVHKAPAEHTRWSVGDSASRSFAEWFLGRGVGFRV